MDDIRISKIEILLQQSKYADAERIIKDLLAENPTDIHLLSLLAEVYLQIDDTEKAYEIINSAIGLAPDEAHLFFVKARVDIQANNFKEAEKSILQAIAIEPHEAHYFALLASIKLTYKKFDEALVEANNALALDAENILAINVRSKALLKLNRAEESFQTIEGALREDPNNAYTHANYGWGLLENGNPKKALIHFKEALQSDPNFEYAQAGMLEAIKATNPIYRMFLNYSFWMGNLTAKYQWGVILVLYFGTKALKNIAIANEAWQPFLVPLVFILALFAFSTWVITPISNLFLRFNIYGKYLLDRKEKLSSNFVAVSLGIFLVGILLYLLLKEDIYIPIAFYGLAMMVPLSSVFSPTNYKWAIPLYAIGLAFVGLLAILITVLTNNLMNWFSVVFMFGFIAFQFLVNFIVIRRDNNY
ncbi:MAG: hypothetical protein CFE21_03170 [Bacteroidetes bacterium B1(2017)]|nr:MAG: hypothetical protein CFE21_03170 [Bacteroidetes bacterium B1(2017)]